MAKKKSTTPVKPLLTARRVEVILSKRRSVTCREFYHQVEEHLGHPLSPAKKRVCVNGQMVWVCC